MAELSDIYNRKFKNLRVSLLETCNFQCTYCTMGNEDGKDYDHRPQQTVAFYLDRIGRLNHLLHLENVRLTGGEPLLYRKLPELIKGIHEIGVKNIKMTSNGFLLERQAEKLKEAGLNSINISLDAIDEVVFQKISKRKKISQILKGIDVALKSGLDIKLNAVIMKHQNEHQILPLLEYAFSRNITIRFLEIMSMGHLYQRESHFLFKQQEILQIISSRYHFTKMMKEPSATANYWTTPEGNKFGIIANESAPFCSDCNRLRLDATGRIYGCLSINDGIYIDGTDSNDILQQKLQSAMLQKQSEHFTGSPLSMLQIGG